VPEYAPLAKRTKASDYESEDPRFKSWRALHTFTGDDFMSKKTILTIGDSITSSRNIARDLIDQVGETILRHEKNSFETNKAIYHYRPYFHISSESMTGYLFDAVYVDGTMTALYVKNLENILKPVMKEFHLI
jgi:hypothetical protein